MCTKVTCNEYDICELYLNFKKFKKLIGKPEAEKEILIHICDK